MSNWLYRAIPAHRWFVLGVTLCTVLVLVAFFSRTASPEVRTKNQSASSTPAEALRIIEQDGAHFYSDRFLIFSEATGTPIVLEWNANRKERPGRTYVHYYTLSGSLFGSSIDAYAKALSSSTDIVETGFVDSFELSRPNDLSARETFHYVFLTDTGTIEITTDTLTSDFLVKDTPWYTKYYSAGEATLRFNGEERRVHFMHSRIYSDNFAREIFADTLRSLTVHAFQFIGWDDAGAFYFVDQADVTPDSPAYATHRWALVKDERGRGAKYFDFDLSADQNAASASFGEYTLDLSYDSERNLEKNQEGLYVGFARGIVTSPEATTSVAGIVFTAD